MVLEVPRGQLLVVPEGVGEVDREIRRVDKEQMYIRIAWRLKVVMIIVRTNFLSYVVVKVSSS